MRTKRICGINSTGQALVEMAIILPLLMLLVMGIFEFGRAMYIKNTLTQCCTFRSANRRCHAWACFAYYWRCLW